MESFVDNFASSSNNKSSKKVYHVQQIVDALNKTIIQLYAQINLTEQAPCFRFNPGSELFSLILPTSAPLVTDKAFGKDLDLVFSHDLFNLFKGFTWQRLVSEDELLNDHCWKLTPFLSNVYSYPVILDGPKGDMKCFNISAEYSSMGEFSDIDTLCITTNLPIVQEIVSSFDQSLSYGSLSILTDLSINPASILGSRGDVQISPNYRRFLTMQSGDAIRSINVKVWTRTKNGKLSELVIPKGSHIGFKLCFTKLV